MRYGEMRDVCTIRACLGTCCAGLLSVLTVCASCERRAPVSATGPPDATQIAAFEDETARWHEQMDRIDAQDQRYEVLLQRWEARADRVDRLLERWEAFLSELEARTPVHGDVATEP